jgi:hypothetical protein
MAEKVLLVCTSTVSNVRKAIGILMSVGFRSYRIDLLCKSTEIPEFEKKEPIQHVWAFPNRQEYSAALKLLSQIRKEKYDVVAVLWCKDAERAKAKCFALLCGGKRLLIFNENLDCEYLKTSYLKAIVSARAREGALLPQSWAIGILKPLHTGYWRVARLLLFPFRFVILLITTSALFCSRLKKKAMKS